MAEFEFGGMTFRGGKMMVVLTALSTAGGAMWGGFEFYKDYMDMKEIIANIDIQEIQAANELQLQKLEDAIGYTQDIKDDLKGDIRRVETLVAGLEDRVDQSEQVIRSLRAEIYDKMDKFEERLRLELKDNQTVMAAMRDNINGQLEASENRIKDTQASINNTLEGIRTELNNQQKDVTASIREVEASARQLDKDIRADMKQLDKDLSEKLQEALNNPLSQ